MGANFRTMTLDGGLSRDEVKRAFQDEQARDRDENGHMYSGGFGMAGGLKFSNGAPFPNSDAAYQVVLNAAEKWDDAIACRYDYGDGTQRWFIGAWCAE